MKNLLIALAVLSFAACSSMKKQSDASHPATAKEAKAQAKATTKEAAHAAQSVTCKHGTETRSLEIVEKDKGCELKYAKGGKTEVPASSSKGKAHCEQVLSRIQKNLEASGYSCK